MPSSGVWRRVDVVDWTDVSEDRIASIFRVEKSASEEPARAGSRQLHDPAALPSEKHLSVPIGWEAGWPSEPVWTSWTREKFVCPAGNWTPAVQPVAHCYKTIIIFFWEVQTETLVLGLHFQISNSSLSNNCLLWLGLWNAMIACFTLLLLRCRCPLLLR
jgi:hypothetical protein